jgi:Domain of unknown function (DUF4276)
VTRFEVLVEGESDAPVVREIMCRRFGLVEHEHFWIRPHRGRGSIPANLLAPPDPRHRGLLDQLPAKLRAFGKYLDESTVVLVLLDVDQEPCAALLARLKAMLSSLPVRPPRVLFRLAIEETESWFLADPPAVKAAFSRASTGRLRRVQPDSIVGASEVLASSLGVASRDITGQLKFSWASRIAPHLDLESPRSPSLRKFMDGVARELARGAS